MKLQSAWQFRFVFCYALFSIFCTFIRIECQGATLNINELYLQKVLQNMNQNAEPCENFYEYACGNWVKQYDSKEYLDVPGFMDHEVNKELHDLLHQHQQESGIYAKIWQYYEACVKLENPALNYYLHLIEDELPNFEWPIFRRNWPKQWLNETQFDWSGLLGTLRIYGLNGEFITQHVNAVPTNSTKFLIELQQHSPTKDLKSKEVADIFNMFGLSTEASENITTKIIAFSEQLNKLKLQTLDVKFENDTRAFLKNFVEMPLSELMARVPQINWLKYFHIVFGRTLNATEQSVQCYALDFEYFNELTEVLNSTSNETICYYLMLKFMYYLTEQLPAVSPPLLSCVKHLRSHMPLAMNFLYEQHIYQSKRQKTDAALQRIYENLRTNFEKLLAENYLKLNSRECAYILAELQGMRLKIGNIPLALNSSFVENYYAEITFNTSNFYANHLQLLKHFTRLQQALLLRGHKPEGLEFYEHDPDTSSSSSPVKVFYNAILVPYGFLKLPLFHPNLHALYQYSLFGFIMAHEITHAYDLFHIVYDEHSNYNELGVDIAQHYADYINCTKEVPNVSLSENLADVVGLRLAYQTYFDDVINSLEAESQPNIGQFTAKQMFFINSVQFLCANMAQISTLNVNELNLGHDMHDARVRQNWANYEKFAEAFDCDEGTSMRPAQMCRAW